jgi:crossover junction endodeoxyribonuclease RuvC
MIIIGFDPGLATTGFGIINVLGNKFELIKYGTLTTTPKDTLTERLKKIHQQCAQLLESHPPDMIAVESLFFSRNTKTAMIVAQARGVLLLNAALQQVVISEYTPSQVKRAISGYGSATKNQIQYMIKQLLNLDHLPKPDDAADALGVAICHAHSHKTHTIATSFSPATK